jgi:hypothetical protein
MKTSIIFLTLLFAVSCKIESSDNAAFIQLTKDPRAEAVLATVAIQMQQNNGFQKVQSLLTDLLNSARDNLHQNNLLFKRAEGRCNIYKHKLEEKDEYLGSLVDSLKAEKITLEDAKERAGDAITARTALVEKYENLLKAENDRYSNEKSFYDGVENTITDAQNALNELLASLRTDGNKATPAFIETKIQKITNAYQKVFNFNIDLPSAFVQMSIDNNAAKQRIVNWLEDINMTFTAMVSDIKRDAETRKANSENFKKVIDEVTKGLKAENANITQLKEKYDSLVEDYIKNIKSFEDFKTKNEANLQENQKYCETEKVNSEKVKKSGEEHVKIYEDLLGYFMENYRKISKMINDKYKLIQ